MLKKFKYIQQKPIETLNFQRPHSPSRFCNLMSLIQELNHLIIPLEDIKLATENFSDSNFIGQGGFGRVYKGQLPVSDSATSSCRPGTTVAVKRLDVKFGQGQHEFLVEIVMLSSYKHDNLVSLVGFCDEEDEKIIVYEHEVRGSLDNHLATDLTWVQRIRICLGAARGLNYLHSGVGVGHRVLHRDIKSSNVLLDENWNAKISDFGLSKIGPTNQDYTFLVTHAAGTFGYIDPLYISTGVLTKESDVYSFGVILFEVLCGRLAVIGKYDDERRFLSHLAQLRYEDGKIDEIIFPKIRKQIKLKSLQTFSRIAYECLNIDRKRRPTMAVIIERLQISLEFQVDKQRVSLPERDHRKCNNLMDQSLENDNIESEKNDHEYNSNRADSDRFENLIDDFDSWSPSMNDHGDSYLEDGPGIEGFQIIGDAKPGGKLLACGFGVRGTTLCMFQWVRHLPDGTMEYIEGATNPEYVVTADDVNRLIAVVCMPTDDHDRWGEIVQLFANEQNKIMCDAEMKQEIDKYMMAGQASFNVLLLVDSSENGEQTTLTLRRSSYKLKINQTGEILIQRKYTNAIRIKIDTGLTTQFVLEYLDRPSHRFNTFHDVRMRDTLVLTMRMFQSKALDEGRKAKT